MRITLVGFGAELAMIAPDRVTAVATLDEALPELEARAAEVEQALADLRRDSVLTGRSPTVDAQTWAPHYLIMAVPPTPTQRERLLTLARTRHRTALGFVDRGRHPRRDVDLGGHRRRAAAGRRARLRPGPPSCCRPTSTRAVVELFRVAPPRTHGVDLADPSDDGAPAAQLVPGVADAGRDRIARPGHHRSPGPPRRTPPGAVHRAGRVPGHTPGRGPPQRADRRDLAPRGDRPRCGTRR